MNAKRINKRIGVVAVVAVSISILINWNVSSFAAQTSVVITTPTEPDSMASEQAKTTSGYAILRNIEESLLTRDPVTNKLVGELAVSWKQVEPTRWRFILREGVTFHDGSPFNAEAAAFALNRMWDRRNVTILTSYLGVDMTFWAIDKKTLDVVTGRPDPILPLRLYVSPISSMKAYVANPANYTLRPVGTGPYKFVEWVKGQKVTMTRYDKWWGLKTKDKFSKLPIKDVTFLFRAEASVRNSMVRTGEADFARWITSEDCKAAPSTCLSSSGVETIYTRFDQVNSALGDKRVRQAISMAIDRNQIMGSILGAGFPAAQITGSTALGYNPKLVPVKYDIAGAKKLIDEARAAGVNVDQTLTIVARRAFVQRIDEIVAVMSESLKQIGLTTKIQMMEQVAFEEMLRAPKPISPTRGYIVIHSHGNELMDYALSMNSYLLCTSVVGTYCNPAVDAKFITASLLVGEKRDLAFQALAKIVADDHAMAPIGQPGFNFGINSKLVWKPRLDGFILVREMSFKN